MSRGMEIVPWSNSDPKKLAEVGDDPCGPAWSRIAASVAF